MCFGSLYIIVGFIYNIYNILDLSYYFSLPFPVVNMLRRSERIIEESTETILAVRIVSDSMEMIRLAVLTVILLLIVVMRASIISLHFTIASYYNTML
jgi:hypothetical protein